MLKWEKIILLIWFPQFNLKWHIGGGIILNLNGVTLKKSIEKADAELIRLQTDKTALEEKLTQALSPADIAETGKHLKTVNNALEALEAQWLAWSEELEKLEQSA